MYIYSSINGTELGTLNAGMIKDKFGKTLYRLRGDNLVPDRGTASYAVQQDGRVVDKYGVQVGYIYNYADYRCTSRLSGTARTATFSDSARTTSASRTATTATRKAKTAPTSQATNMKHKEKSNILMRLIISAAVFFAVFHLVAPPSIVGSWKPYKVAINGKTYSYSEYERIYDDYHNIEYNFRSDGTVTAVVDGKSGIGSWYKSSGRH